MATELTYFKLIKSKLPGRCKKSNSAFIAGDYIWWNPETKDTYLGYYDPPFKDHFAKRAALSEANVWALRKLCLIRRVQEIFTIGGGRKGIYQARKRQLIEWLMRTGDVDMPAPEPKEDDNEMEQLTDEPVNNDEGNEHDDDDEYFTEEEIRKLALETVCNSIDEKVRTKQLETRNWVDQVVSEKTQELTSLINTRIEQELEKRKPTIVHIKTDKNKKPKKLGLQHKQFPTLLAFIAAKVNVYMVGPAGSGKSRAASEVAKALKTSFYSESVNQQSSVSLLKGYMDAHGKYIKTGFRQAFEKGGVFLLDEIDGGNANVITALNAAVALDPGECASFPDKMVPKHPNFVCVAAANTIGRGADREYVGRFQLDAASLDRFVFLEWGYDENLERELCKAKGYDTKWVDHVIACREIAKTLHIRLVISPRASLFGGALLKQGQPWEQVEEAVLFKGVNGGTAEKIRAAVHQGS